MPNWPPQFQFGINSVSTANTAKQSTKAMRLPSVLGLAASNTNISTAEASTLIAKLNNERSAKAVPPCKVHRAEQTEAGG